MSPDEREQVLRALLRGRPVYVQRGDGSEAAVYSLEFRGAEAVGWREKGTEALIPAEQVVSVSLDPLTS